MLRWIKKLGSRSEKDGNFFFEVKKITGFRVKNGDYYRLAFRHSSASTRDKGMRLNNQRLEYLGDAILGAVVADFLYKEYPKAGEGFLTSMRSKIVSRRHLDNLGHKMGLQKFIIKKVVKGNRPKSITGDTLEALIAAVYLDHGYGRAQSFIIDRILKGEHINLAKLSKKIASHKANLLEWSQKNKRSVSFELTNAWGESHSRKYEICVSIDGEKISTGKGTSKKKAEEEASKLAYQLLKERNG